MKKLNLKIGDKDYTLEMNRDTVKWLENYNFSLDSFINKPVTYYDLLWASLFLANHKDVNPSLALKLMKTYEESGKKTAKVIQFAIEEYKTFMNALADIDSTENEELEIIEA